LRQSRLCYFRKASRWKSLPLLHHTNGHYGTTGKFARFQR